MRRTLARLSAAALLGALSLPASTGWAQVRSDLPTTVTEAASIGSSEQSRITEFVTATAAEATGADAEAADRARAALVAPLNSGRPSVAFRQAYSQAVSPTIATLTKSEDAGAQLAGLRVAGSLGTGEAAATVRSMLTAKDTGVRLFAAVQARRVFEVTSSYGPALTDSQASQLVDDLVKTVDAKSDPLVVQATVRALSAGAQLRPKDLASTRSKALTAMCDTIGARVRSMDPKNPDAERDTILTAADAATRAVSEVGANVTDAAAKSAAQLGGDILALVLKRHSGNMIGADRDTDTRLVRAGEALVYFARRRQAENARQNAAAVPQFNLVALFEAKDRNFRNELVRLIGPGSDFLRQFGLPDDRFVK